MLKNFLKTRQQALILAAGYVLAVGLGFGLGRITAASYAPPEIRVEEAFAPLNDTPNPQQNQLGTSAGSASNGAENPPPQTSPAGLDCKGQIKGNIGSKGEKVYHMPGGSFYNRTKPEACFATEAEAQAAGFRRSSN